jgi:hypothetical protein
MFPIAALRTSPCDQALAPPFVVCGKLPLDLRTYVHLTSISADQRLKDAELRVLNSVLARLQIKRGQEGKPPYACGSRFTCSFYPRMPKRIEPGNIPVSPFCPWRSSAPSSFGDTPKRSLSSSESRSGLDVRVSIPAMPAYILGDFARRQYLRDVQNRLMAGRTRPLGSRICDCWSSRTTSSLPIS